MSNFSGSNRLLAYKDLDPTGETLQTVSLKHNLHARISRDGLSCYHTATFYNGEAPVVKEIGIFHVDKYVANLINDVAFIDDLHRRLK